MQTPTSFGVDRYPVGSSEHKVFGPSQILQEVVGDQEAEALQQVAVLLTDLAGQQLLQQGFPAGG